MDRQPPPGFPALTTLLRDLDMVTSISSKPLLSLLKRKSMASSSSRIFRPFATVWMAFIHSSLDTDHGRCHPESHGGA